MLTESTPYKPYKAYTPEFNTIQKRLAGNYGNAAQGNRLAGGQDSRLRDYFAQNIGGQTWNMRGTPSAGTSGAGGNIPSYTTSGTPGSVNTPSPQYPYPQVQNPPYYQAPTPTNAINYAQAIADAPAENKDIAKMVADAYRQFLGREADTPGYMAHYARALAERAQGKTVDWNTIMGWLRNSEEGQRYPVMRDVGLQVDPELQAAKQAYDRWVSENQSQVGFLDEERRQASQRLNADYGYQMEDLGRAVKAEQSTLKDEMIKRGIWQSGITDKNLQDIAQKEMLARGRIGGETMMGLGNVEQSYALNIGDLQRRAALYGGQYNDQVANLMQRREGLISQGLDKQLDEREEKEWQEKLFKWEQDKWNLEWQLKLAEFRRGAGGGGGGYGGGDGTTADSGYFGNLSGVLNDMAGSVTSYDDALSLLNQSLAGGATGLNTYGMTQEQKMNAIQWMMNNPGAAGQMLRTNTPQTAEDIKNKYGIRGIGPEQTYMNPQ